MIRLNYTKFWHNLTFLFCFLETRKRLLCFFYVYIHVYIFLSNFGIDPTFESNQSSESARIECTFGIIQTVLAINQYVSRDISGARIAIASWWIRSERAVTISGAIGEKKEGFRSPVSSSSRLSKPCSLLYRQSGCSRIKRAGKGRRRELGVV